MKIDFDQIALTLDDHIRHGKGNLARKELRLLAKAKIPRGHATRFASLARRANLPSFGIRVLNPIVRPSPKSPIVADDAEKAEYAACLNRIGAGEEALGILRPLPSKNNPEVLLFHAFALIHRWSYQESIPLLTRYLRSPGLREYEKLVGKVNLAAALVFVRDFSKATVLLRELLYETSLHRYKLIHGNALELAAQNYVLQRKWGEAEKCLKMAQEELREAETLGEFYVRKWMAIIDLMRSKGAPSSLAGLKKIRQEARELGSWEAVRQCDEFEAISRRNEKLAIHVYYGTPYETYRKQLLAEFPISVPEVYAWFPAGKKPGAEARDLLMGEKTKRGERLKAGQVLHRLLWTLSSDFYRPFRVASVHFSLYPDEYFNPVSSPPRVHEAVKRLRQWLEENEAGLTVEETEGFYRLGSDGTGGLIVRHQSVTETKKTTGNRKYAVLIQSLREAWPKGTFSINEAAARLEISARSTLRLLGEGLKQGDLQRLGKGYATRYCFAR